MSSEWEKEVDDWTRVHAKFGFSWPINNHKLSRTVFAFSWPWNDATGALAGFLALRFLDGLAIGCGANGPGQLIGAPWPTGVTQSSKRRGQESRCSSGAFPVLPGL